MDEIKDDYETGDTFAASDVNTITQTINEREDTHPMASGFQLQPGGKATGITSTITTGYDTTGLVTYYAWNDAGRAGKYRFSGMTPRQSTLDPTLCHNGNLPLAMTEAGHLQPITIEMQTNATEIRWFGFGYSYTDAWITVDGQRIRNDWQHLTVDQDLFTWKIALDGEYHIIKMQCSCLFYTLATNVGAKLVSTTGGLQVAVVTDSYGEGNQPVVDLGSGHIGTISAGMPFGEFEQKAGVDVHRFACGGTSYSNPADQGANGPYGSTARIAAFDAAGPFDVMIAMGSLNGISQPLSTEVASAEACWTDMKVAHPEAELIVIGPEAFNVGSAGLTALNNGLRDAAVAHVDVIAYIDLQVEDFITGTGHEGAPAGDGNADLYIASDNLHLTHLGARYWGLQLTRLLGQVALVNSPA